METIECYSTVDAIGVLKENRYFVNICLSRYMHREKNFDEFFCTLIAYPNRVKGLYLYMCDLTDASGVKIAQFLAASNSVKKLSVWDNKFSETTFFAVAAALRVNTSLELLSMNRQLPVDQSRVEAEFVDALRHNPLRPVDTRWHLFCSTEHLYDADYTRLKTIAEEIGHPTLQSLLNHELEKNAIMATRRALIFF